MPSREEDHLKALKEWHERKVGGWRGDPDHDRFAKQLKAALEHIQKLNGKIDIAKDGLQSIRDLAGHPEDPALRAGHAIGIAGQLLKRLED
ncbi:MAG TPA: hypothetical protein VG407_05490 [Caulobacteraceae bacterium]|nr:hypothetical protein [Caulobacteraceae bacterium]